MSFKLLGDQFSQIKATQKRRRADLLLDNVPDDEAHLMKNGRYACLVCSRRPTFDTIEMLAVHRQSQRHAAAAVKRAEEQASLQLEIMKREQNRAASDDKAKLSASGAFSGPEAMPLVADTKERVRRALSKWSAPYDPRVAGHRDGAGARHAATTPAVLRGVPPGVEPSGSVCEPRAAAVAVTAPPSHQPTPEYVFPARAGQVKKRKLVKSTNASSSIPACQAPAGEEEAKKKARSERVVRLLESGWVLCNDGSWVRDPSAEFDSDEEPPSPL